MLDFLHEQQEHDVQTVKSQKDEEKPAQNEDKSKKQDGYFTVETQSKKLQKSTVLLIVVFATGMLGLLFMIKKGAPQTIEAAAIDPEQAKIDLLIARLGGVRNEMSTRIDKIIKKFYEFSNPHQIPISNLIKNPFAFDRSWQNWGNLSDDSSRLIRSYDTDDMQLLSVMKYGKEDARWCCMINDKILYEGDYINGFKVHRIEENFVRLLSSEGTELVLKLMDDYYKLRTN